MSVGLCYWAYTRGCSTGGSKDVASIFDPALLGKGWYLWTGTPSRFLTSHQVNSALHPSRVTNSCTSFGWGKGGNVTSAWWQVTLCDPIWHICSRNGEAELLLTAICFTFTWKKAVETDEKEDASMSVMPLFLVDAGTVLSCLFTSVLPPVFQFWSVQCSVLSQQSMH